MKRALAVLLALLTFSLPVLADGEVSAPGPDEFVPEIMEEYSVAEGRYAVAFRSMYDGETWLYNSDEFFKVASVYKLPLNMYFYEMEAAGEIEPDATVGGVQLDLAHYYSLEFSNNEISEAMLDYLGGYKEYKDLIQKYMGDAVDEVTPETEVEYYYDNAFTADMLLEILNYLYTNSDTFSEQLEHMLAAQPDEYLESGELDCDIAQKYGSQSYDGVPYVAVAGIVYADEPFLITILTRSSFGAASAMGAICDAFAEWDAERIAPMKAAELQAEHEAELEAEREELTAAAEDTALDYLRLASYAAPLPFPLPWDNILDAAIK